MASDGLAGNGLRNTYTRLAFFLVGASLLLFFAVLFVGAIVNLPASWVGVIYSGYGMLAGVASVVHFFHPVSYLPVLVAPAVLLMGATLSGVFG